MMIAIVRVMLIHLISLGGPNALKISKFSGAFCHQSRWEEDCCGGVVVVAALVVHVVVFFSEETVTCVQGSNSDLCFCGQIVAAAAAMSQLESTEHRPKFRRLNAHDWTNDIVLTVPTVDDVTTVPETQNWKEGEEAPKADTNTVVQKTQHSHNDNERGFQNKSLNPVIGSQIESEVSELGSQDESLNLVIGSLSQIESEISGSVFGSRDEILDSVIGSQISEHGSVSVTPASPTPEYRALTVKHCAPDSQSTETAYDYDSDYDGEKEKHATFIAQVAMTAITTMLESDNPRTPPRLVADWSAMSVSSTPPRPLPPSHSRDALLLGPTPSEGRNLLVADWSAMPW